MRAARAQRWAFPASAGLALFALGTALYASALRFGFVNWDDPDYVLNNPWIRDLSLEHLRAIFTRSVGGGVLPVHLLSYAFDYAIWELDPFGYHLHSVLLNALNGVLAFLVIERLSSRRDVALIAATLFTVHSSHVEAVAWISARKDLWFTTFLLLSTAAYLRARRDPVSYRPAYAAALALFALGLLAKTTISAYPLFFLLVDVALDRRRPPEQRQPFGSHLVRQLPFLALAAIWLWVNTRAQVFDPLAGHPLAYALVKGQAGWRYGWLLLGLLPGQPLYDLPLISFQPVIIALTLAPLILAPLALLIALWRGYTHTALALGWLIAGLVPPVVFPVISFIADRYLYAPSLGFCWLIALAIAWNADRMRSPLWRTAMLVPLTALPALWFAQHARHYTPVWRDSLSMWSYAAQRSRYRLAAIGLVTTLGEAGRLDEALSVADASLEQLRNDPLATGELVSNLHSVRAAVLSKLGRRDEAIDAWQRALEADPRNAPAREQLERARAAGDS